MPSSTTLRLRWRRIKNNAGAASIRFQNEVSYNGTETTQPIPLRKAVSLLIILLSVAVMLLAALQIFGIWENAVHVFVPLLGFIQLGQAYIGWHVDRKIACFNIAAAGFILICAVIVFFVR